MLLTVKQVAERLQVSRWFVAAEVRRGWLAAYRIGGKLRFRAEDVELYTEQHAVTPHPEPEEEWEPAAAEAEAEEPADTEEAPAATSSSAAVIFPSARCAVPSIAVPGDLWLN